MWLARLRGSGLWIETWLRHPRRDAFWQHGSVCEDFAAIQCPVFAVGGWLDGYTNAIPRLMQGLAGPRRGLIGQWAHRYPHMALPGPAVGFLQLAVGWWDRWLKGRRPAPSTSRSSGCSSRTASRRPRTTRPCPDAGWRSAPGRPRASPRGATCSIRRASRPSPGPRWRSRSARRRRWGSTPAAGARTSVTPDRPLDQRLEDGGALVFDTDPRPARVELLGAPVAELELAADRPVALLAARLSDVAPDGAATRVSYGLLNLTHRESHEHPTPLQPGRRYRVRLQLNDVGQAFPPGTGSGSRSRPPTGRSRGRRPSRSR